MYISIQRRDTLYFDKLNIPAPKYKDISNIDLVEISGNRGNWLASGACFGPGCCQDPSQFIYSVGKCVNPPTAIYDYTAVTPRFKTAYDTGAGMISLPAGKTIDTLTEGERKSAEWNWNSDDNRWENSLIGANGSYWDIALKQIKDRPILGIGPGHGTFNKIYPLYMQARYSALGAYSIYLETALELGIIGLLSFLWLIVVTIGTAVKEIVKTGNFWLIGSVAALAGMLGHGFVDTVWYRPEIHVILWILIGYIASQYPQKANLSASSPEPSLFDHRGV
jgi:hypothetical protein